MKNKIKIGIVGAAGVLAQREMENAPSPFHAEPRQDGLLLMLDKFYWLKPLPTMALR